MTMPTTLDHSARMDRMYRYTRHVYDASRRYFLFGRDRLLERMELEPGTTVAEIGCGTARNLVRLARRFPQAELYGLDASEQMLETAQRSLAKHHLSEQVTLRQGLAESLDPQQTFGLEAPLDHVFFSYSLSMMPTWSAALDAALTSVKPGGSIWIVDFWDQAAMPSLASGALQRWLALFHVHYRPELPVRLAELEADGRVSLEVEPVGPRYAMLVAMQVAA